MDFDVFNGDADGIVALHQCRLQHPNPKATLITGVKRDINLLSKILDQHNSQITVFDISLDSNRDALTTLLRQGNNITYIDHHFAGTIPASKRLTTHIDPSPSICTSLIVDGFLGGKYRCWAIAAAFGDNLHDSAREAAATLSLSQKQLAELRELGELLNYNGYGADLDDLHFAPDVLYRALRPYDNPFSFINDSPAIQTLQQGFKEDMERALGQQELDPGKKNRVYLFPNAAWSRRVAGVFSNLRAREKKDAAHALIVENNDATLRISVRAPLHNRKNADTLCRAFPTGGGRTAAAGINMLPLEMLDTFLDRFHSTYPA